MLVTLDGLTDPDLPTTMGVPRARAEMPKSGWLGWLECHNRFKFENPSGGKFTAYKSAKGYWTAQRRVHGKLRHEYLGASSDLIYETLDQAARKMSMSDSTYWQEKHPNPRAGVKANIESHKNYETESESSSQTAVEIEELKRQLAEAKNATANLERLLSQETERADEYCLEELKAAKILHESLKLPANKGGAIKIKIRKALELIDDV